MQRVHIIFFNFFILFAYNIYDFHCSLVGFGLYVFFAVIYMFVDSLRFLLCYKDL